MTSHNTILRLSTSDDTILQLAGAQSPRAITRYGRPASFWLMYGRSPPPTHPPQAPRLMTGIGLEFASTEMKNNDAVVFSELYIVVNQ